MRDYELVVIVSPEVTDENLGAVNDRIGGWIADGGGEVTNVNVWGRRRLAYPINDNREGTYVVIQAKTTPKSIIELERSLRLSDDVLRHMVVVVGE